MKDKADYIEQIEWLAVWAQPMTLNANELLENQAVRLVAHSFRVSNISVAESVVNKRALYLEKVNEALYAVY